MAGIFQLKNLERRREALAAESDIYRHTLRLDAENLRLAANELQSRIHSIATPLMLVLSPLAGALLAKRSADGAPERKRKRRGLLSTILLGFRLYRRFGPVIQAMLAQRLARSEEGEAYTPEEEQVPAAQI